MNRQWKSGVSDAADGGARTGPARSGFAPSGFAPSGFTLIELLVVLAIVGLLAGLVGPNVLNALGGAKTKTAAVQVKELEQALEMYKLDVGRYPTTSQGLEALVNAPGDADGWNGPYIKSGLPKDPWNQDYQYANPGTRAEIDIFTLGQDGSEGGEGENEDVGNW